MSFISPYMHPAKLMSYDNANRTAKVTIAGLTDGLTEGITAMLAYPIGDDDLDTERELLVGADVWVFFEQGDVSMPVVAFYRRHGQGRATVDVRRIRQENIELLARTSVTITAKDFIDIKAKNVNIEADTINIKGNVKHVGNYAMTGNQSVTGKITSTVDVVAGNISVRYHKHGNVKNGSSNTSAPQ